MMAAGMSHQEWLNSQPLHELLGVRGRLGYFTNEQGLRICEYFWPATAPAKAVLLCVHGHGTYLSYDFLKPQGPGRHTLYSESWIEALNRNGFSVYGMDLQGCGRSDGLHCYVERFEHYVRDVVQGAWRVADSQVEGFRGLPIFILGASLGGNIALRATMAAGELFRGIVLLAPMLSLEKVAQKGLNPYLRPLGGVVSALFPTWRVAATNKNDMYPELQACWDADPCTQHHATRARNATEYLAACQFLMRNLERVTLPLIVYHSERDTMTDPEASKELFRRAQTDDKTLRQPNCMWHVITKEEGNVEVLREVMEWMGARCVAGVPGATAEVHASLDPAADKA